MRRFLVTLVVFGSFAFAVRSFYTQPSVALAPTTTNHHAPISTPTETIDWIAERDWRKEHAKRPGSLVWVHFTLGKNCQNCDIVNRNVLADAQIIEASKTLVCVKLVGPSNRIAAWHVTAFPTDLFLGQDRAVLKVKGARNVPTPHTPEAMGKLFLAASEAASQRRKENEAISNFGSSPGS